MSRSDSAAARNHGAPATERNRQEVIRFPSDEECKKAIGVLLSLDEPHRVTSYDNPNEWWVRTALVRKLKALGIQFQWLTENV
jgi:hypothetical protein